MILSPIIAVIAVLLGVFVSATWVFPAGASIALVSGLIFFAGWLLSSGLRERVA
jgi:manganese/iron transport system permease protein